MTTRYNCATASGKSNKEYMTVEEYGIGGMYFTTKVGHAVGFVRLEPSDLRRLRSQINDHLVSIGESVAPPPKPLYRMPTKANAPDQGVMLQCVDRCGGKLTVGKLYRSYGWERGGYDTSIQVINDAGDLMTLHADHFVLAS